MQPGQVTRLNKFLAERLGISRRAADRLIENGDISVEKTGEPKRLAVLGDHIDMNVKVWYNSRTIPVGTPLQYTYLALNKPVGYVCSRKKQGDTPTIYEILPKKYQKLKTVGRLDKNSSGLILLTDDGDFAFQMTHPKFYKEKQYEIELDRALEPLYQQMIADFGVDLPDGKSKLGLSHTDNTRKNWLVTMSEGRNRQIRRTFSAVGYEVIKLHRIQFGKYRLEDLPEGEFAEVQKVD